MTPNLALQRTQGKTCLSLELSNMDICRSFFVVICPVSALVSGAQITAGEY